MMNTSRIRFFVTAAVLIIMIGSLVPMLSGCKSGNEVDTSGMYLVVYDGNGGYLGNKSSTVRKLYCNQGSKIPDYPVEYSDNQYTVSSLGRAMREGYNLMGWYASDDATYKESENGEYVFLSVEDGNGIYEIDPSGEYVRKYQKSDDGEFVYVHVEESENENDTFVFINSVVKNDESEEDDTAEQIAEEIGESEETSDPETETDETDGESAEEIIVLSVESGFYICNGEETINEIDDENLRDAYRKAYESKVYSKAEVAGISGWQNYDALADNYREIFEDLDRFNYTFAAASDEDEGLERYSIQSGYASLFSIFTENEKGNYYFVSPYFVEAEDVSSLSTQRYSLNDRYVFTPDDEVKNPSYLKRYDATMDYWDFANDTVTEDACEWDGEKFVLTLNAHWVKKNTVYYHYENSLNQIDEQWTRLLADNITAVPIRPGEIIGRKEVVPQNAGYTFVAWSKTPGEYDPWNFETDLFPEGETELHLYAYYIEGNYTRITSASGLSGIGKNPDGHYLIVNNIDLGGKEITGSLFGLSADSVFTGEIFAFDKTISNFTLKLAPSKQQAMDSTIVTSAISIPQAKGAKISGLAVDCKATVAGLKAIGSNNGQKKNIKFAVSPLFGNVLAGDKTVVENCHITMSLDEKTAGALTSDAYTYVINYGGYAAYASGGVLTVENSDSEVTVGIESEDVRLIENLK